jgi:DNA-directed RNA polymerase specialized sigma24 family protein
MDTAAEQQFREFVVGRSATLMRLAYLLAGGDQHEAEDLLQIALAKTAARWVRVDNPETYVRRVMYHQQVSSWRLKWRRREVQVAVPPEQARHDDAPAVRFFEDLPEAEVAGLLGISVGTVRSTTHRSLARLREVAPELEELRPIKEALQ